MITLNVEASEVELMLDAMRATEVPSDLIEKIEQQASEPAFKIAPVPGSEQYVPESEELSQSMFHSAL